MQKIPIFSPFVWVNKIPLTVKRRILPNANPYYGGQMIKFLFFSKRLADSIINDQGGRAV